MDLMIDLLVLGVSGISQPIASIPPCDPCRSSRWTARMHRILCPPALSPCRAAAPGSNVDTWSSLNRKPTFPTFQVVKVGIFFSKNYLHLKHLKELPATVEFCMFHLRHIHTSLLTFTIIPFLLSIQKGKQHWKNLSASLPGFSQLWTALPRKTTLLRSCCKRISLQGKTQKHGPFHWIPMAFSCCLAVYAGNCLRPPVLVILAVICIQTSCSRTSQTCPRQPKVLKHLRNEKKIRQTDIWFGIVQCIGVSCTQNGTSGKVSGCGHSLIRWWFLLFDCNMLWAGPTFTVLC